MIEGQYETAWGLLRVEATEDPLVAGFGPSGRFLVTAVVAGADVASIFAGYSRGDRELHLGRLDLAPTTAWHTRLLWALADVAFAEWNLMRILACGDAGVGDAWDITFSNAGFLRMGSLSDVWEMRAPLRPWQRWTLGAVREIQAAWLSTPEQEHRRALARLILEAAGRDGAADICEVGCGTGLVHRALLEAARASGTNLLYRGVDNSFAMLGVASTLSPTDDCYAFGDLFNLPDLCLPDTVVCCEVLGHLPDIEVPLRQLMIAARKRVAFSLWVGAPAVAEERWHGQTFLHVVRSHEQVCKAVELAWPGARLTRHAVPNNWDAAGVAFYVAEKE